MINPWRGLGSLPKAVWILFTVTLINRMGTMVLPFLVLYLTQRLNYSAAQAGLVLTIYGIGAIFTSPLSGRLCDRIGAAKVMQGSLLISGLLLLLLPLTPNHYLIAAGVFVWAIFNEAFRPASFSIIGEAVAAEQRKSAFALNRLAVNLGMSIGPVLGGLLTQISYTAIFIVDGATSIFAGIVLTLSALPVAPHAVQEVAAGQAQDAPARATNLLTDFRLLFFLAALLPITMVMFQPQAAMPLFLVRDLKMSEARYGALMAINTVMIIFLEVPLTLTIERWPHRRALALGTLLCGVGFGALAIVNGVWGVGATIAVWTFGEMILFPGSSAYIAEIAPAAKRGAYMGMYLMTFSLSFAIAPWLGSAALDRYGAGTLWAATFFIGCGAAAMMLMVKSKPVPSE
ncbi:MAG: MFS transporter [Acidobacteria bacterium]|nr:MFS transporter [Acidobacteriota bacterium]